MEASAIAALEYCKKIKKERLELHQLNNANQKQCRGLTDYEWFKTPTKQKNTFSKAKKFSYTRLWSHNRVSTEQGLESLTIKYI
jgi:ribonuclease HI